MSSFPCFCFFFFILCFPVMLRPSSAAVHSRCKPINAIYSFGDSIADTGNLIREGVSGIFTGIQSLPYGETTFRKPTGRCSNGLLIIDYLALASNLPLLEPSLNKGANFSHGINFAVAGATALDKAFHEKRGVLLPFTNSSLHVQIQWFKAHLNSICSSYRECKEKLENALFVIGEIGGNDYNYAFFSGKSPNEVKAYVPRVVKNIIKAAKMIFSYPLQQMQYAHGCDEIDFIVQRVIHHGATHIIIPGNFPIGCLPVYLTIFSGQNQDAYDEHKCLIRLNDFSIFHNEALIQGIDELRVSYPHVLIIYADYYHAYMDILKKAQSLDFDPNSMMKVCCGSGGDYNFNISRGCGAPGTNVCENPTRQLSWDGIHPTQEVYKIMAHELIYEGYTRPSNEVTRKCKFF